MAKGALRYDLNTNSDRVRIRYPEGMSWLVGGALRLTGRRTSGVVSGKVTVQRVTLTQGLESASALVSSKEGISGPSTSSSFLRNLQFDIEAASTPDARMEWPGAELEADASLRVRGTWEHPILLGHIHLAVGRIVFCGQPLSSGARRRKFRESVPAGSGVERGSVHHDAAIRNYAEFQRARQQAGAGVSFRSAVASE